MIPEIKPLSDESDILREASAVPFTVSPRPQPPIQAGANGPTPASLSVPEQPTLNTNIDATPVNNGYDPSKIYGKEAIVRLAAKHSIETEDVKKIFTYRLPRFSYVLIWFYGFMIFILSFMFLANLNYINAMKDDGNSTSLYSYSYTSTSNKEDVKPYAELLSVVVFGISNHEQNLKYVGIPLVLCILMLVVILSGNRIFRYIGVGVCLLVIAYLLYLYIRLQIDINAMKSSYSYNTDTNSTFDGRSFAVLMKSLSMFNIYLPYLFFPMATFIYLLTPTAREAYN